MGGRFALHAKIPAAVGQPIMTETADDTDRDGDHDTESDGNTDET
jgi:hypothetical protein